MDAVQRAVDAMVAEDFRQCTIDYAGFSGWRFESSTNRDVAITIIANRHNPRLARIAYERALQGRGLSWVDLTENGRNNWRLLVDVCLRAYDGHCDPA